jgi:methylaspartate mutase sigma subunit
MSSVRYAGRGFLPEPPAATQGQAARLSSSTEGRYDVVLSGLSSDAHTWNLVFVQLVLEELGYSVRNLGPCVPDGDIVAACREHSPDLLVVASINGHGVRDGQSLLRAVRECPELMWLPVAIGGVLGIDGTRHADELRAAGFDAVFEGDTAEAALRAYARALKSGRAR